MKSTSINVKMTVAFLSVSLISILLLGYFSNVYYSKAVEKDFFNISKEAVTRLNHHMEYYFKQIRLSSSSLLQSQIVQQWLSNEAPVDIDDLGKDLKRYIALNYSEIAGMGLLSKDGRLASITDYYGSQKIEQQQRWSELPLVPEMKVMQTHKLSNNQSDGEPILTLLVPIYSTRTLELSGMLIIDLKLTELDATFSRSNLGKTGIFFILSKDDVVIYHPESKWLGLPRSETDLAPLNLKKSEETSVQLWQGKKMLHAVIESQSTGWSVVTLVPFDEMNSGLVAARNSTYIVIFIIFIGIVLVVPLLSFRFVQPIRKLKRLMSQVAKGNLDVRADMIPGNDEFQQLNLSFNVMIQQLNDLMVTVADLRVQEVQSQLRQKVAVIHALQNQINPHLLYNSLEIIRSLAYLENVPMIETMSRNLADLYRYTAKWTEMTVSLKEELHHLKKYLEIIHIRFPKYFQSEIVVPEQYLSSEIVKLTLQPIVENAVKYAIEPLGGRGSILVSAYTEKNDLIIEITDNGPGFEKSEIMELKKRLTYMTSHIDEGIVKQDSLGLTNVHARLVMKYGEEYGITLTSYPGRGSVISVRIPYRISSSHELESIE
ncbi:histidine kinase [Paenibacillus qinlingensis]|uniref:cache domain-containing sensor histidine kinase n=1 Tax=Paenibacillus qinlingensis TaxID=1837343 RepID=UPI00286AD2C0|nr:cache domain-containing protein [Paenibacillus qinlingensis]